MARFLLAILLSCPTVWASRLWTADELARSRLNDALLNLRDVPSASLDPKCKEELDKVQTGLLKAGESLDTGEGSLGAVVEKLDTAEARLDKCLKSMSRKTSRQEFQARARLRNIGRTISNAEQLMQVGKPSDVSGLLQAQMMPPATGFAKALRGYTSSYQMEQPDSKMQQP